MNKPVQNKQILFDLLLSNQQALLKFGVKRLGVFGSFVKGEIKEGSDVDFFIEFFYEYKTLKNFIALAGYLKELSGRRIEIITPQSLNPFIGKHITQEVEYVPLAA